MAGRFFAATPAGFFLAADSVLAPSDDAAPARVSAARAVFGPRDTFATDGVFGPAGLFAARAAF